MDWKLMLQNVIVLVLLGLLGSCAFLEDQAKREETEDREACIASGYKAGSEAFDKCMEYLDDRRAQHELRTLQRDLDEYERYKEDRLIHHLGTPDAR